MAHITDDDVLYILSHLAGAIRLNRSLIEKLYTQHGAPVQIIDTHLDKASEKLLQLARGSTTE